MQEWLLHPGYPEGEVICVMGSISNKEFLDFLLERFKIERNKFDRSGVYAYTQRLLAYNSIR